MTFLFTDLVDSTPLWEERPADMRVAVADLASITGELIRRNGGVVVKSIGDGTMAAFQDADSAADAAVALQLTVLTRPWPVSLALRVGLHTGHAEPADDDYLAPAVNRAARIASAAHGGQVLLSADTAALLAVLPTIDLGQHRLKGLPPIRLHQLVADALPRSFPPLTTGTTPGVPPSSPTSFVGREADLDRVADLLATHRLVTLTGAGGSGKTRLALEVLARHPTRVAFADLAPASTEVDVVVTMANALGLSGRVSDDLTARVSDHLAAHELLCALDNCEHVLDPVAAIVDDVLHRQGQSRLLLTSREPLGVEGEQVCVVAPLPVETDAVALFVERAREVRSDLEVDTATQSAIGEICRRLDGLPLAIELAAARIAHLSAPQLLERLDDRFRVLTGGRRRVARHQTLAATLDWSHDLLSPDEQAMLRRLSAFPASFSLDGAEALAGIDHPVDVLGSLVAKSLVQGVPQPDGLMRYRLLETVRVYAEERLVAAGEGPALRRAHRDLVVDQLDRIALERRWFGDVDVLAEERAGIRSALQWSADEGDVAAVAQLAGGVDWSRSADWSEGCRWCDLGLAREADLPLPLRHRLLVARLVLSQVASEPDGFTRAAAVHRVLPGTENMLRAIAAAWVGLQHTLHLDGGPGDAEVSSVARSWVEGAVEASEDAPVGCRIYCRLLAGYTYLALGALRSVLDERGEEHLRAGLADSADIGGYDTLRGGLQEYLALHALVHGSAEEALRLVREGPHTSVVPMLGHRPRSVEARALAALGRHDDAREVLQAAREAMRAA
ncbi:MAG TPA: adenylate/guanylate cyclase domain-containing protein, partial [Ornithinibacter sp.]|nr:adenylate/guanylate cyclase domain-containing protein [Ornithinibacter sp.]